jgi:hypothetical protein
MGAVEDNALMAEATNKRKAERRGRNDSKNTPKVLNVPQMITIMMKATVTLT